MAFSCSSCSGFFPPTHTYAGATMCCDGSFARPDGNSCGQCNRGAQSICRLYGGHDTGNGNCGESASIAPKKPRLTSGISRKRSATGAYRGQTGTPVNHQTCGCTESVALNFDNDAYYDDGSCQFTEGCTFQHAPNYDPNACWDNGTCTGLDDPIDWPWQNTSAYEFYWQEVAGRNCCANLDIYDAKTEWGGNQCGGYIDWETTAGPLCADLPPEISNVKNPKKPLYQSGISKMRSATGGGKRSVGTAVNWLTPLI